MRFLALAGILTTTALVASVHAADRQRDFDIPPQDLGTAIEQFIEQGGIDLLYDSAVIRGKTTAGVSGRMTLERAVETLLRDSGLRHIFTAPRTVALQPAAPSTDRDRQNEIRSGSALPRLRMPPMAVIATRDAIDVGLAPAAVSVIGADQLDLHHATTLDQALRAVPGTFARRSRGLMDTNGSISFRGFPGQRRTMVMVDGLPLNDIYSAEVNLAGIDLNTVERIEVARGPFSSLYGGNAMSGVINVVTAPIDDSGATLSVGYGDAWHRRQAAENLFDSAFNARLKISDALGLSANYRYRVTDGYPSWHITRPWRSAAGTPAGPDIPAGIGGAIDTVSSSGAPISIVGDGGYNGYRDATLSLKAVYRLAAQDTLVLNHTRSANRYAYGERNSLLRDTNGNAVFGFAPGPTASGATSTALDESAFLAGAPGGMEQRTYGASYLHGHGGVSGKLILGYVDADRNWFVTASLRPRPGTEGIYAPSTRDGGRGLLSQSWSSHGLVDYQITLPLAGGHALTAGASLLRGEASNEEIALRNWRDTRTRGELRSRAEGTIQNSAIFIQDQWHIDARITAYLGLRHDRWQARDGQAYSFATVADAAGGFNDIDLSFPRRSVGQTSPRAALVYQHNAHTSYRASIGYAFRPPSVFELYRTWFSSTSGTEFRSNPALTPETSRSWEIGLDHTFANGINLAAAYFDNAMDDFIYRLTVTGDAPVSTFHNAARASSRGVEIGLKGDIGALGWRANYTYTDAVIDAFPLAADPSLIEGKRIVQFPKQLANLGLDWRHRRFTLGALVHYSDERYSTDANTDVVRGVFGSYDSPTLVDVKLSYRASDTVRLSLAVDNLFDEEWYDFYRAPGRSWFAQVSIGI
jgi:iron complex outermembrane receptor protein